ncbi:MAG: ABC transporter ATP-binding protein [Parasporobacterium sp.]|nr:ABC transporter ATP-binding protein [Parasporobacterium sp.]
MEKAESKMNKKQTRKESWHNFWLFFKNAKLSWFWIAVSTVFTIIYYRFVTKIPGSAAALMGGNMKPAALKSMILNFSLVMLFLVAVNVLMLIATARSVRSVRKTVWTRMMGIQSTYYDKNGANTLLSAVTSDTQATVAALMNIFVTIPGLISYLINALPQINSFSPKLMWAILILIPVYIIYSIVIGIWQYKTGMKIQMRIGILTGFLADRIRNLSMIKSFATEEQEEKKGIEASKNLYKTNISYSYLNAIVTMVTILLEVSGVIIAVIWGSKLLKSGEITLESWLAFFLFAPTINTVFRQLTGIWSTLKEAQGRASRLGALMVAPSEDYESGKEAPVGDIVFENVSFSYREDETTLDNISLTLPAGKTTVIVGPSGSGKTTILKLIEKLYSPASGTITVGGEALSDINIRSWRNNLSYVNQSAELFSGTVKEALTYGLNKEVSEEELDRATKISDIYDFIKGSKDGYETKLAAWGGELSGGQRQRMVIAREVLRNADILLLDEPTSALDTETATAIGDTFFKGFNGKTVIAVTHDLGYIAGADQIIVVNYGKIIGTGTHEELMSSNEIYKKLVSEQSYQEVFE